MPIRLDNTFNWSRRWLLICVTVFSLCLVVSQVAIDASLVWYTAITGLANLLLLLVPLLALMSILAWGLRRMMPANKFISRLLRGSAWSTLGAAGLFTLSALVVQLKGGYRVYDTATLLAQIVFLASLPLLGTVLLSGTALALRKRKKQPGVAESPMSRIMQRLQPEERDYLKKELDQRYVGLGTDGELISLDDLMEERDEDEAADSL